MVVPVSASSGEAVPATLKYRSDIHRSDELRAVAASIHSPASLVCPYGFSGRVGDAS